MILFFSNAKNDTREVQRANQDHSHWDAENESPRHQKSEEPVISAAKGLAKISPSVEDDYSAPDLVHPEDDDAESENLSPPPESIELEDPEDEIVVGSGKGKAADVIPTPDASKGSNVDEMDYEDDDEDIIKSRERSSKRKRNSIYEDLAEEKLDSSMLGNGDEATPVSTPASMGAQKGAAAQPKEASKTIILGYWRDSEAPEPDQHVVKGFIDSRDRLRTRIQTHNRAGETVTGKYPLKPGPGGSWVTFHNIVFDDHLVHLDQHQVKEYVKIRAEFEDKEGENPKANDTRAVQQAIKLTQARGPPAEGALPPLIAYGATIPDHARISYSRAEKRRRTAAAHGHSETPDVQYPPPARLQAGPGPAFAQQHMQTPPNPPILPDLPGKRPTKIMLGYWLESIEPNVNDKHAVFGILGNNDMFRVKVGRETRDGRPMQSNFPQGAGALWINAHQWQKEDYLQDLSREELKEYCRVRQYQIDQGERNAERDSNIRIAIGEARRRAAFLGSNKRTTNGTHTLPTNNQFTDAIMAQHEPPAPAHETRQAIRRAGPATITPAASFRQEQTPLTPGFRAANRGNPLPPHSADPRLERANNLAMHAVSRIEANQAKVEERDAHMAGAPYHMTNGHNGHNGDAFRENLGRLNNVWSQQEAHRIRTGNEDAKIHLGTKYERKATGPFAGKLVSQGAIISIDGEDYVEYRVLTKPSFI